MESSHYSRTFCVFEGCSQRPVFGEEGNKDATLAQRGGCGACRWKELRRDGVLQVPIVRRGGLQRGGVASRHEKNGIFDLCRKSCSLQGRPKYPTFYNNADRTKKLWSQHERPGMVDHRRRQCASEDCTRGPSSRNAGRKKTESWSEHMNSGTVAVCSTPFDSPGCSRQPPFRKKQTKGEAIGGENK